VDCRAHCSSSGAGDVYHAECMVTFLKGLSLPGVRHLDAKIAKRIPRWPCPKGKGKGPGQLCKAWVSSSQRVGLVKVLLQGMVPGEAGVHVPNCAQQTSGFDADSLGAVNFRCPHDLRFRQPKCGNQFNTTTLCLCLLAGGRRSHQRGAEEGQGPQATSCASEWHHAVGSSSSTTPQPKPSLCTGVWSH
jgi:hypothetical protein